MDERPEHKARHHQTLRGKLRQNTLSHKSQQDPFDPPPREMEIKTKINKYSQSFHFTGIISIERKPCNHHVDTAPTVRQPISTLLKLLRRHKIILVIVTQNAIVENSCNLPFAKSYIPLRKLTLCFLINQDNLSIFTKI